VCKVKKTKTTKKKEVLSMTKMTYVNAIDNAIALFSQGGQVDAEDRETVEKLEALKAQLAKRNSGTHKPTKTQKENEGLKEDIFAFVSENGAKRAGDVASHFGISGQKATALLKQIVDSGRLEKYVEKRVTFFRVAEGF
jgi:predicted HTH transcriptional regulator